MTATCELADLVEHVSRPIPVDVPMRESARSLFLHFATTHAVRVQESSIMIYGDHDIVVDGVEELAAVRGALDVRRSLQLYVRRGDTEVDVFTTVFLFVAGERVAPRGADFVHCGLRRDDHGAWTWGAPAFMQDEFGEYEGLWRLDEDEP